MWLSASLSVMPTAMRVVVAVAVHEGHRSTVRSAKREARAPSYRKACVSSTAWLLSTDVGQAHAAGPAPSTPSAAGGHRRAPPGRCGRAGRGSSSRCRRPGRASSGMDSAQDPSAARLAPARATASSASRLRARSVTWRIRGTPPPWCSASRKASLPLPRRQSAPLPRCSDLQPPGARCRSFRPAPGRARSSATLRSPSIQGELMRCLFEKAEEALGVAVDQRGRGVGIEARGLDPLHRRAVVEVEGVVGAQHQLAAAEAADQVAQGRGVEHQRVVEEAARLFHRRLQQGVLQGGEHARALLQARQQRGQRAAAVAEGDPQLRPPHRAGCW